MVQATVIVPARNAQGTLPRTLAALAEQEDVGEYEVIVVDDGSTDGTAAAARGARGSPTVLEQGQEGPAAARNRGAALARGQVLAFCDADCFPTPRWLSAGVAALRASDLVQGHVLPDPDARLGPFDRTLWITSEVGLWETANLFVTRELFESVGGFEEWLRPEIGKAMAEDVWFGWRAKRAGGQSAFCEDALAYHAVFPQGRLDYVLERRRLRYFPAMARKMPELREHFFFARWFLNRRSAAFDAALLGAAVALARRSPVPLAAVAPYGSMVLDRARKYGPAWRRVAAADLVADGVGLASLALGSVRARAALL